MNFRGLQKGMVDRAGFGYSPVVNHLALANRLNLTTQARRVPKVLANLKRPGGSLPLHTGPVTPRKDRDMTDEIDTMRERSREGWREVVAEWRKDHPLDPTPVVYFIGSPDGPIKIGYSKQVHKRLCELQLFSPCRLEILATTPGSPADERLYHHRFADHRLSGEWFEPHPDILAEIDKLKCR